MQKMAIEFGQSVPTPIDPHENDSPEDFNTSIINLAEAEEDETIQQINQDVLMKDREFMSEVSSFGDSQISRELREKANIYRIKSSFLEKAKALKLPQFFPKSHAKLALFDSPIPLQREELTSGFTLKTADANITLE